MPHDLGKEDERFLVMLLKITDNIYISGVNEAQDFNELRNVGITAILNLAWEVESPLVHPRDFTTVKVGLIESPTCPEYLKSLAVVCLDYLVKAEHKVLVHCVAGVSRSPYVVFRYLAEQEKRDIKDIYSEYMRQYPKILISPLNYSLQLPTNET